jgi:hypothetical protein
VFAAAATVVVFVVTLGAFLQSGTNSGPQPLSLSAHAAPGDAAGQILKIGFDDHVFCAIDHDMASKRFTLDQMSERLGPQYEGLVGVVRERMPEN